MRNTRFTTGIQRVITETHRGLVKSLDPATESLHGFSSVDLPGENYLESPYLATDPVLSKPLVAIADLDIALLLDLNLALSFRDLLLLKKQKSLSVVSVIHDITPILNPEWLAGEPALVKKYFRDYLQKTIALSDHIILCSNKVKQDIQNLGWKIDKPVHVFQLGATRVLENSRERVDDIPTVIYVSTIEPRKGHLDLLEAFEILRKQGMEIRLEIVGRPGWKFHGIVERITSNPDYGTYLLWHSNMSDEGVAELYNRASLSVIPSYDEGFGLGIEEALARQVVVLARKIPVFLERPNPNIFYFDSSAQDLADAIQSTIGKEWIPLKENSIRTMGDFAEDIHGLLTSI